MVGAVLVRDGEVVGEGFHRAVGEPHAEVEALAVAGARARGATLYVTLEPCCHHGRTGPCTDPVIAAGVRRVVVGVEDPNPRMCGRGVEKLRAAGIEVLVGVREEACRALNAGFLSFHERGRPHVLLKLAVTLDGRLAAAGGDSRWVTAPPARRRVQVMRAQHDAIAVGSETALRDDPLLTLRTATGRPRRRQPRRVIFDGRLRLRPGARLFTEPGGGRVVVVTRREAPEAARRRLREVGAEIVEVAADDAGLDLGQALAALGEMGILSVMCEGGAGLASSLLRAGLVDQLALFVAPKLLGGAHSLPMLGELGVQNMDSALMLGKMGVARVGPDLLITAVPER